MRRAGRVNVPRNAFKDEGVLFVIVFNPRALEALVQHHEDALPQGCIRHERAQRYCLSSAHREAGRLTANAKARAKR